MYDEQLFRGMTIMKKFSALKLSKEVITKFCDISCILELHSIYRTYLIFIIAVRTLLDMHRVKVFQLFINMDDYTGTIHVDD